MCSVTAYLGVAQFGSVLEWGSRGRRFESSHPDFSKPVCAGFFLFSFCSGLPCAGVSELVRGLFLM